jgi:hypothetical protein
VLVVELSFARKNIIKGLPLSWSIERKKKKIFPSPGGRGYRGGGTIIS